MFYRIAPLAVVAVMLAVLVGLGEYGWLAFALGVLAGRLAGDWLGELELAVVPLYGLAVTVAVAGVAVLYLIPVSEVVGGFVLATGAFTALEMVVSRRERER